MEYYNQDIKAFEKLGHEVYVCNRYKNLPLKFDIIYIWWWTYALLPILFAKILGKKSIVTGTFNYQSVDKLKGSGYHARSFYQRYLIKLAAKLTDSNLFVGKKEFDLVPKAFNLKNVFYFPHAVAESYFNDKKNLNRKGILNIAWSGKENLKRKGIFDILEAIKILKDRNIFINCSLAGREGDGFNDLVSKIKNLEIDDRVITLGEVSLKHKLDLFSSSMIYVQPSYFEGFGLATAEALASGCCVIACDVGEVKNVLGSGAYYINPGNQVELANAIEKIYKNSNFRNKLISNGKKRLKKLYSQSRKKDKLNKIIYNL